MSNVKYVRFKMSESDDCGVEDDSSLYQGPSDSGTSMIELSISGRNLREMDVSSKLNPMCVVSTQPFGSIRWKELLRTECIPNTLNPNFAAKIQITYCFDQQQHLRFEMYDMNNTSTNLKNHNFIGSADCTLAQIVSAEGVECDGSGLTLQLNNNIYSGEWGDIIVLSEELSMCRDELELEFMGKNLTTKDWFTGSLNPFLQISRANECPGDFTLIQQTEHTNNNVDPTWERIIVPLRALCNGDLDRHLKFECMHYKSDGSHTCIGDFFTSARQLIEGPGPSNTYSCIHPQTIISRGSLKQSGEIHLIHSEIHRVYSFLDYIRGGTELACTFAIDFTTSNGDPTSPDSLHHITPNGMNQYELAIESVGTIMEGYDSDKLFPVLGFGALLPPDGRVSHDFYVNGDTSNPNCEKVSGVLSAYKSCIRRIQLHEPTNFAPVINHVASIARNCVDGSQYFILLIVTDGVITDMEQTKTAIVDASTLAMSIIIVGVGEGDFDEMEELDGDTDRVTDSTGRVASRDIVQFVQMRNFLGVCGINSKGTELYLAKELLAEIPDQLLGFMRANKSIPKNFSELLNGQSITLPLGLE